MTKIKIISKKIIEFKYIILLYIIIILLLLPILQLTKSVVPTADDFWYGKMARLAYKETGSIFKTIEAAIERTIIAYKTWQGTYSSIFIMSMQPGIFSLKLYRIAPIVLILISLISPLFLVYTVNKYLFNSNNRVLYVLSAIYSFVTLQFMPSIFEGIYWFNSAWYYTFSFNLVLIMIGVTIIFEKTSKKNTKVFNYIIMILFSLFLGGTNYPQVLMLTVGYSFFIFLLFIRKNINKWLYVICWLILGICIAINVFAPGNRVVVNSPVNLRYTTFCMIRNFTKDISSWSATYLTLAVSCISIPFLGKLVKKNNIKFLHPAIMGVATFLILLCMYTPSAYTYHHGGPLRTINIRMMVMEIIIYINVINGYGYYYNKKGQKSLILNPIIAMILFIFILCSSFTNEKIMSAWSIKAEYSIMGLEVSKFSSRMNEFFDLLEDDDVNKIKVDPLPTHEMLMPNINMFKDYNIGGFYEKEETLYYKQND